MLKGSNEELEVHQYVCGDCCQVPPGLDHGERGKEQTGNLTEQQEPDEECGSVGRHKLPC